MRLIPSALLIVFFTSFCFAQEIKYGVRGGITISNLDYEGVPIADNPHRNGLAFGVYIDYGITEDLSIVPELQYSADGANEEGFRNDYVNLPLLFKYRISQPFSIGVGPKAGLKVNKKDDGFKNMVFSGVVMVEVHITEQWSVDGRYCYGFSNVFDNDLLAEAKNGVFQIGLNYKI